MQGVQAFEPTAKASIDLESFVAKDHFLRRIGYHLASRRSNPLSENACSCEPASDYGPVEQS
jgi:hypothetical protein